MIERAPKTKPQRSFVDDRDLVSRHCDWLRSGEVYDREQERALINELATENRLRFRVIPGDRN